MEVIKKYRSEGYWHEDKLSYMEWRLEVIVDKFVREKMTLQAILLLEEYLKEHKNEDFTDFLKRSYNDSKE